MYGNDYFSYGDGFYNYGGTPDYFAYDIIRLGGGILLALSTFFFVYFLISWIFRSVGLYHLAKNRGINHAWFAWIPILSDYVLGKLINNKVVFGEDLVTSHADFFLPFLSLIAYTLAFNGAEYTSMIAVVITTSVWVYHVAALWRLFKIYRPKNRVSFTIWSTILTAGFFIFAIKDDKPFDPLEPDRKYVNFYAQKNEIKDQYKNREANLIKEEEAQEASLKNDYETVINQPNITDDEKKEAKESYHTAKDNIEAQIDNELDNNKKEYKEELKELKEESIELNEVYSEPYEQSEHKVTEEPITPFDIVINNIEVDSEPVQVVEPVVIEEVEASSEEESSQNQKVVQLEDIINLLDEN